MLFDEASVLVTTLHVPRSLHSPSQDRGGIVYRAQLDSQHFMQSKDTNLCGVGGN